ncbi:uncharacterized protein LOC122044020 [Zingiber officinale]|uniref:uncharacterized protein LOC122044020 n=1 Tax=Zingiber officinale TaxID=94328 RepID=UPI001C4C928F|nr:uncharacterized protein LOC122044020 [Zingiber officinale]
MRKDVADFVSRCLVCQQVKAEHQGSAGLLEQIPISEWNTRAPVPSLCPSEPDATPCHCRCTLCPSAEPTLSSALAEPHIGVSCCPGFYRALALGSVAHSSYDHGSRNRCSIDKLTTKNTNLGEFGLRTLTRDEYLDVGLGRLDFSYWRLMLSGGSSSR